MVAMGRNAPELAGDEAAHKMTFSFEAVDVSDLSVEGRFSKNARCLLEGESAR